MVKRSGKRVQTTNPLTHSTHTHTLCGTVCVFLGNDWWRLCITAYNSVSTGNMKDVPKNLRDNWTSADASQAILSLVLKRSVRVYQLHFIWDVCIGLFQTCNRCYWTILSRFAPFFWCIFGFNRLLYFQLRIILWRPRKLFSSHDLRSRPQGVYTGDVTSVGR